MCCYEREEKHYVIFKKKKEILGPLYMTFRNILFLL